MDVPALYTDDRRRIRIAGAVSVVIHAMILTAMILGAAYSSAPMRIDLSQPLQVRLEPPSDQPVHRLVETSASASEPVKSTDLIAEQNANASSPEPGQGPANMPNVAALGDYESLGSPAAAPPQPATTPSSAAAESAEEPRDTPDEAVKPDRVQMARLESPVNRRSASEREKSIRSPSRAAQAQPQQPDVPAPPAPEPPSPITARQSGGAKAGFLNFEAMRSELAPYLREIQRSVEKRWRIALELKYRGTQPTNAVVDCAIGPDGKIVYVNIVEPGNSVGYAYVCKEAIEKAGPFPPFPFKVPEMYRDKNLEIRWTFNFL